MVSLYWQPSLGDNISLKLCKHKALRNKHDHNHNYDCNMFTMLTVTHSSKNRPVKLDDSKTGNADKVWQMPKSWPSASVRSLRVHVCPRCTHRIMSRTALRLKSFTETGQMLCVSFIHLGWMPRKDCVVDMCLFVCYEHVITHQDSLLSPVVVCINSCRGTVLAKHWEDLNSNEYTPEGLYLPLSSVELKRHLKNDSNVCLSGKSMTAF